MQHAVLNLRRRYAGQNLKRPVNSGTAPIQPQGVLGPTNTREIKTKPATIRIARSAPPTLHFIEHLHGFDCMIYNDKR